MRDAEYVVHPWEVGGQPRSQRKLLQTHLELNVPRKEECRHVSEESETQLNARKQTPLIRIVSTAPTKINREQSRSPVCTEHVDSMKGPAAQRHGWRPAAKTQGKQNNGNQHSTAREDVHPRLQLIFSHATTGRKQKPGRKAIEDQT